MPGGVIGISMNVGYPGTQSRQADAIIQNRIASGTIAFGAPVKLLDTNKWAAVGTGDTAGAVAGIAVREVVQANTFNPQSNPDYVSDMPCDVMVRGNCTIKCQRGTPKAGNAVYVRVAENTTYPDAVIGGFEAEADGSNSVQVTNIEFTTGVMDSNGNVEVTIKTRAKG